MPAIMALKNQIDLHLVISSGAAIILFVLLLINIGIGAGLLFRTGALRGKLDSHVQVNERVFDTLLSVMNEIKDYLHRINGTVSK